GDAERCTCDQTLEVVHRLERLAQLRALDRPEGELLDRIEAVANRLERDERAQQPRAEEPAAHRRHRLVELGQQRSLPAALAALDHLEVLQGDRIDQQMAGLLPESDRTDVGEVDLLRVAQMRDERTGGGDRGRTAVEAEALQALRPQLIRQRAPRRLDVEEPGL